VVSVLDGARQLLGLGPKQVVFKPVVEDLEAQFTQRANGTRTFGSEVSHIRMSYGVEINECSKRKNPEPAKVRLAEADT
jgi:hypothetical protein